MIVSPCFEIKNFYLAVGIVYTMYTLYLLLYIYIYFDCSTAVDIVLQRKVFMIEL